MRSNLVRVVANTCGGIISAILALCACTDPCSDRTADHYLWVIEGFCLRSFAQQARAYMLQTSGGITLRMQPRTVAVEKQRKLHRFVNVCTAHWQFPVE